MFDKQVFCEKFINKGMKLVILDEKFLYYTQIVEDLGKVRSYYDCKSVRINLKPLIDSICSHAVEWRNTLGRILAERTNQKLIALKDHIRV